MNLTGGLPNTYNFTDAPNKAAGFQALIFLFNRWGIRGGDVDGDGDVGGLDYQPVNRNFGNSSLVPAP